jgi:hypothetical protein
MALITGDHGSYRWLTTDHELDQFLTLCPETVMGRYVAVTAIDSGALVLKEADKIAGWERREDIAYSSRVHSVEELPHKTHADCCDQGYDEWYITESPTDLGQVAHGNIFVEPITPGQLYVFVNFIGFAMHEPVMESLVDLFWKQLEWIQPESYLSDGRDCLIFVSRDDELFTRVCRTLKTVSV